MITTYEVAVIIVGAVFLGFYLRGLFRLIAARKKTHGPKPLSRAAGA